MNILALESSTEACSVAICNGEDCVERFNVIGRGHAEHLLPMIDGLLEDTEMSLQQIDLFAYGAGPGSFTGLRIGAAMMQGLALAQECKLTAISSLAALATRQSGLILSVTDARMDQVYYGFYHREEDELPQLTGEVGVASPADIVLPETEKITVVGTGWDRYKDEFNQMQTSDREIIGIDDEYPHAADIVRLAMFESEQGNATAPEHALPHYVRNKVANTMAESK